MPFTLSHTVLAAPIAKLTHHRLPIAALAIGCMTPDLPRLLGAEDVVINHQWSGLIVPDLLVGGLFCLVWYLLYRPAIYRWNHLEDDLYIDSIDQFCGFAIRTIIAIVLGTITHILWDGFTHADYRTLLFKPQLSQNIAIMGQVYPLHMILQVACSIIALPFIFAMTTRYVKTHQHTPSDKPQNAMVFYTPLILSSILGFYWSASDIVRLYHHRNSTHLYEVLGDFLNQFARGFLFGFSICCLLFLVFHYARKRAFHL